MEKLDCVVIGGGIVGLAVARRLALAGREVVVLEAEDAVCTHTSSRNSEVIHAGIYYPQGSLKARLCVEGRRQLYAYCAERGIAHKRLGKLIVACTETEVGKLRQIEVAARANGVTDLERLTAADVAVLEPAVRAVAGLLSPSSGIVDSHGFAAALEADLEAAGGVVVCRSLVTAVDAHNGDGFVLTLQGEGVAATCRTLVNAAGLRAAEVAGSIRGFPAQLVPRVYFAKGHYFVLQGKSPFARLVYPLPDDGGLGVHVTLDTQGAARFGPDVAWVESLDYRFDESRKDAFVAAIRRYWPEIEPGKLSAGYTGIRPKLSGPGMPAADFMVQGPEAHGVAELVNLFGIESPGLTAALPLAEAVRQRVSGRI